MACTHIADTKLMLFNLHEKNRFMCFDAKTINKPSCKNAISINGLFW
jgi:hypothetical protein